MRWQERHDYYRPEMKFAETTTSSAEQVTQAPAANSSSSVKYMSPVARAAALALSTSCPRRQSGNFFQSVARSSTIWINSGGISYEEHCTRRATKVTLPVRITHSPGTSTPIACLQDDGQPERPNALT